jgi:antitoxin component YwqK of YwqJK toxin-antitoxin module
MKFAHILLAASIAIVSCRKNKSNPGPGTEAPAKKITRIEENGSTSAAFTYNANGSLKTVSMSVNGTNTVFTFSYNAQNKPSEVVNTDGLKAKYVYENGGVKMIENYDGNEKISENHFTYENNRVKSNTLFIGFPGEGGNVTYLPMQRNIYHYSAAGALEKVSTYEADDFDGTLKLGQEYVYAAYDAKKNPLTVFSDFSAVIFQQPVHSNNPLIEKLLSETGTVVETTNNVYTYDAAGYPLTCTSTSTFTGGQPTVTNLKYFY